MFQIFQIMFFNEEVYQKKVFLWNVGIYEKLGFLLAACESREEEVRF